MRIKCSSTILACFILFSVTACGNTGKPVNSQESISIDMPTASDTDIASVDAPLSTSVTEKNSSIWVKKKDMPVKLLTQRAVVMNDRIYVLGTMDRFSDCNNLYEYDPSTDNWIEKSSSIAGKGTIISGGGAAVANGKLYTFGGGILKSDEIFDKTYNVQEYDPKTDKWVLKGKLPNENYAFGAAAVNDRIYIVGGESSVLDEYDPVTNKWVAKSAPPLYFQDAGTIALNGRIYAISGAGTSYVSEYDPKTDEWTLKSAIITKRIHLFPVAVGNMIFAINGILMPSMKHSSNVEVYNPEKDEWSKRSMSPVATYSSATAAVNGKIYLIGGTLDGDNAGPLFSVYEYDPALEK